MPAIDERVRASEGIEDLHRAIITGRGHTTAIGRPGESGNAAILLVMGIETPLAPRIPYLHLFIHATRGDIFAIRRPRHRSHLLSVTHVARQFLAIAGIHNCY